MNVSFFSASVTGAYLEAEVHPNAAGKFEADYLQITGEMPVIGEGYGSSSFRVEFDSENPS